MKVPQEGAVCGVELHMKATAEVPLQGSLKFVSLIWKSGS